MAESKLKIDVTADATKAKQELSGVNSSINNLESSLKTFGVGAAAVTATIAGMVKISKELISAYSTQQIAETKLNSTLAATGNQYNLSATRLKEFASNLQSVTRFGDEAVIEAESLLVATKKLNEEGIERTLTASADLAEALGTDITSAASTLAKVLQDPTTGLDRLKQSGINFTEQEKDQITKLTEANKLYEAQSIVLDKVEASYGGIAEAIAQTDTGTLDQIKNVWGDIKEGLGEGLLNAISPALQDIYEWLQKIQRWIDNYNHTGEDEANVLAQQYSNYDNSALAAIGNSALLDMQDYEKRLKGSGYNINQLENMSYTEAYSYLGADLYQTYADYDAAKRIHENAVEELTRRIKASIVSNKADSEQNVLSQMLAVTMGRTGSDIGIYAENGLAALGYGSNTLTTSSLINRNGTQILTPYLDPSLLGLSLSSSASSSSVESANSVASRLRANTIATYDQTKGKNAQSYYEQMAAYYANGAHSDTTGQTYIWEAAAEESTSAFDQIKANIKDLSEYAESAFSTIASSLSSMWTNQANNIKKEMESLRSSGELTVDQEKEMTQEMNELNRKAFVANQLNSIAEATSSYATGVMNVWKTYAANPAVAGIMTGILTGTYGAQVATISAQSYTPMAKGGIVTSPTHTLIGESGTEAIIPLNSNRAKNMIDGLGNGVTVNITIEGNAREEDVYYAIERAQRTGLLPRWSYS